MRLIIVPRWAGDENSDFYPWLREQLGELFASVQVARLLPTKASPTIAASVGELAALLAASSEPTMLLGHSVGNQVIMRTLAASHPGSVQACLLVAGWFEVDEPWPDILPWMTEAIDLARTRASAGGFRVLLSDDDPFTSDVAQQQRRFQSELGASVRIVPGVGHFNDRGHAEVLEELRALFHAVSH